MFYFPRASAQSWGADLAGVPTMMNPQFDDSPVAMTVLMVPVKGNFRCSGLPVMTEGIGANSGVAAVERNLELGR
jgi:hypothetical protein